MANQIRVRLRAGEHEFEAEGPRELVDELLKKWWGEDGVPTPASGSTASARSTPRQTARRKSSARPTGSARQSEKGDKFDPQPIVNGMRDHDEFEHWQEQVLDQRAGINKVMLVSWYADRDLTTGEIASVLAGLGVKTSTSSVSKAVDANLSSFLQSGARKKGTIVKYRLTAKARRDFEAQLASDD